ncbi:DUF1684 domain-containing protein [Christiangramia echinicola]|uniref:DUF1684 domain-containing protein n=1 Tax=Christiangramia echinicola TaxID=279359 RepID=A0A1H1L7K4_9FLAO|nr:DUF1684 domain-containing protein [Christiangramia echinicola]SDR70518.1 hypothetical protein SAMN04488552_0612 [Christiangramia echinicola]
MKFYFYILNLILIIIFQGTLIAQEPESIKSSREFQKELDHEYADPKESPLEAKDLKEFKGLDFFEVDASYIVKAEFVRTPSEPPFAMKTSTERLPIYVKYGELYFSLNGKDLKLNVYQNQDLVQDPKYFDYLFLPFTDLTNGDSTYAGGRYIDLRIPESNEVLIDFNKAYNPYCAYSGKYSCPVPPEENDLEVEIFAGVKSFDKH